MTSTGNVQFQVCNGPSNNLTGTFKVKATITSVNTDSYAILNPNPDSDSESADITIQ